MDDALAAAPTVLVSVRQSLLRDALRSLLETRGLLVSGTAATSAEAVQLAAAHLPNVLLLDCGDSASECLGTLRELGKRAPAVRVLLYASDGSIPPLAEAILAGARGVVSDDTPAELFVRAVKNVSAGEYWVGRDSVVDVLRHVRQTSSGRVIGLVPGNGRVAAPAKMLTSREFHVIRGIAAGESNREMAARLGLSEATVKYYVTTVYDKLGVSNRAELTALAVTRGLTEVEPPAGADGPAA